MAKKNTNASDRSPTQSRTSSSSPLLSTHRTRWITLLRRYVPLLISLHFPVFLFSLSPFSIWCVLWGETGGWWATSPGWMRVPRRRPLHVSLHYFLLRPSHSFVRIFYRGQRLRRRASSLPRPRHRHRHLPLLPTYKTPPFRPSSFIPVLFYPQFFHLVTPGGGRGGLRRECLRSGGRLCLGRCAGSIGAPLPVHCILRILLFSFTSFTLLFGLGELASRMLPGLRGPRHLVPSPSPSPHPISLYYAPSFRCIHARPIPLSFLHFSIP